MRKEEKSGMTCEHFMRLGTKAKEAQYNDGTAAGRRQFIATARKYFILAAKADNTCVEAFRELSACDLPGDPPEWGLMVNREAVRMNPGSVEANTSLGIELLINFHNAEAIKQLQLTMRLAPGSTEVAGMLGTALCAEKKWREAEEVLVKVPELDVMGGAALIEALKAQNKTAELKKYFETRIKTKYITEYMYYDLAEIYRAEGDFSRAIELAEELGRRYTYPLQKFILLIDLHLAQGMINRALALSLEAVKHCPEDYEIHYRLFKVFKACGDIEGSLAALRKYIKKKKTGHLELARELITLRRLDEAETELRRALTDSPLNEDIRAALSEVLRGRGDLWGATALWEDYAKSKKDESSLLGLANEFEKQGNLSGALKYCLKAIKLARKKRSVFNLLMRAENIDDRLSNILKLAQSPQGLPGIPMGGDGRIFSQLSKVYSALGSLFQECSLYDKAAATFGKAAGLSPRSIPTLYALASALKSNGDMEGALKTCKSALALFPEGPIFNYPLFKFRERIEAKIKNICGTVMV